MFNTPIYLIEIQSVQDSTTGRRTRQISKQSLVYADKQEIGLNEFYSSQAIHIDITGVFEIPKHLYNKERFVLTESNIQYEIYRVGKGRNLGFVRLVLKKCKPQDLAQGASNG